MMTEMLKPKYIIDTCSLIDAHSDADMLAILERLIKVGRMKTPPGVLLELEIGGDDTYDWAKRWQGLLVKELSPTGCQRLDDLLREYGKPFPDPEVTGMIYRGLIKKGTSSDADPEVVALALENRWVVVTEEKSGIKGACKCENVQCISLQELINNERQELERQLPLV